MNLFSLQLQTTLNYEENLNCLINKIHNFETNSLILAPELTLTGYAYDNLNSAIQISNKAIDQLIKCSTDKTISFTLTTKENDNFYNTLHIFYNNKIIHTQSKYKLFPLGKEDKYFTSGSKEDIKIIEIDGIKIGCLICFELRFIELCARLKGADIILIPAMWSKNRKEHLEALSKALAIVNQCYVVVSNSADDYMARGSGIITPFGEEIRDDEKEVISHNFDLSVIKKMRRYINVGIK